MDQHHRFFHQLQAAAPPPPPDHVAGQPWSREQIEYVALQAAGRPATAKEIYTALRDRISQRYRRPTRPDVLERVIWLISIEAAVAMRDTARPEARPAWEDFVADLMSQEPPPVPGTKEPDYSAWMPQRLEVIEADGAAWRAFEEAKRLLREER